MIRFREKVFVDIFVFMKLSFGLQFSRECEALPLYYLLNPTPPLPEKIP